MNPIKRSIRAAIFKNHFSLFDLEFITDAVDLVYYCRRSRTC